MLISYRNWPQHSLNRFPEFQKSARTAYIILIKKGFMLRRNLKMLCLVATVVIRALIVKLILGCMQVTNDIYIHQFRYNFGIKEEFKNSSYFSCNVDEWRNGFLSFLRLKQLLRSARTWGNLEYAHNMVCAYFSQLTTIWRF